MHVTWTVITAVPYAIYGANTWDHEWRDEQHLAHALAKRHRVLYVDPPMSPLTPLGNRSHSDWGDLISRGLRFDDGVGILRPLSLPPVSSPRSRTLSRPIMRRQVRWAARRLGIEHPVVLAAGGLSELAGALRERLSIFLMEDWYQSGEGPSLLGQDPDAVAAADAANCDAADLICVISPALRHASARKGWDSVLLRHGFDTDVAPLYDNAPVPPEYASLPRPIAGYIGSIDGRLDFQALVELADGLARGSLVLVGPVSPRLDRIELDELLTGPNVHHVQFRNRVQLPPYVRHLDCCLMPYLPTEFAAHGSPSKLWEYLYSGAPIVGMGYPDLRNFPPPLAHFVDDARHFADVVVQVLSENTQQGRDQRRAFALANSWDARARELDALVEQRLGDRFQDPRLMAAGDR